MRAQFLDTIAGGLGGKTQMKLITLNRSPQVWAALKELNDSTWPRFLLNADVRNWSSIYTVFQRFQLLVLDGCNLVAAGLSVPFEWNAGLPPPSTIDEVVYSARWPLMSTGVLCALGVLVRPKYRRQGLSRTILLEMRNLSQKYGLHGVLAPVRPSLKHEEPEESIESYADRRDETGRLWDPWLRVHEELGGERLGFANAAVSVNGSLSEWESWTEMRFRETGSYCIPEGLVPINIDLKSNRGAYNEPNIWYYHRIDS